MPRKPEPYKYFDKTDSNEEWRDVVGFEGRYEISNKGRVLSHITGRRRFEKIMSQKVDRYGYITVRLSKVGFGDNVLLHRIIAEAFIPNPENHPQVNHIDGNKQNNCIENLEWCSHSYNQIHAYRTGLKFGFKGGDNPMAKLTLNAVRDIRKRYYEKTSTAKELSIEYGVSDFYIYHLVKNNNWEKNEYYANTTNIIQSV